MKQERTARERRAVLAAVERAQVGQCCGSMTFFMRICIVGITTI
jgi:hypothetical protein